MLRASCLSKDYGSSTITHSVFVHPVACLTLLGATTNPLASPSPATASPQTASNPLPLVIWHGLGDKSVPSNIQHLRLTNESHSYDAEGLKSVGDLAQKIDPGTYVYYIRIDDDPPPTAPQPSSATSHFKSKSLRRSRNPPYPLHSTADQRPRLLSRRPISPSLHRTLQPPSRRKPRHIRQPTQRHQRLQNCEVNDWVCQGARGLLRATHGVTSCSDV
jgi:palmitoyl-protein thioesterase